MERATTGQAAIRHPSPAATPAGAPDAGEHGGTPGIAPRALSATATRAAAMNGAEERRLMPAPVAKMAFCCAAHA